jgi:putative DNA primase/helicase
MSRLERIVAACGGVLLDGGSRALIPGPDHSTRDRSVSLRETEEGRILIHCFSPRDDWRAVRRALADRGLLNDETPPSDSRSRASAVVAQPGEEARVERARKIWEDSQPIRLTAASNYLRRRAVVASAELDAALRFHPRMTSLEDRARRPALVAAICDREGLLQGVQVTLLTRHGGAKAPLTTPRRVIGRLLGGTVRLMPTSPTMVVAEGIESALSAADVLKTPAWAALSAHNLSRFEPPAAVRCLIIASDSDPAGVRASETLLRRVESAGLRARIEMPPAEHGDWNDVVQASFRAGVRSGNQD